MTTFEISLDDSQERWDELLAEIERTAESEARGAFTPSAGAAPPFDEFAALEAMFAAFWLSR